MKKQRDTLELVVDRGPRWAETRRKTREGYLKELGLDAADDHAIDQEIGKRIRRAKSMRDRAGKLTDEEKYEPLSEIMAVFLLASEPKSRRLKLQRICIGQGVTARSNTRLLHLAVRALGSRERREAHRDSVAVEYVILQGVTPSTLVSYFKTSGQGLDATYDRAVAYFRGSARETPKKMTINAEPKGYQQSQSVPADAPYFGYFINTEPYPTLKTCITNPSIIKAMIALIGQNASRTTPSSKKPPVTVSKEGHRVIAKRPASQSQGSSFQGKFTPSPGPRAKSAPYREGS